MDSKTYKEKISFMHSWADALSFELGLLITDSPPKTVYHYTDANGLIGLVKSGCIWATHVSKLNDSSENKHGMSLVMNFLQKNTSKSLKPLINKTLLKLQSVDTFVACYSTEHDLLSQWRNYTGTQVGYSIGLETCHMAVSDGTIPLLEPVIYKEQTAINVLSTLLNKVEKFVRENSFGEVEVGYLLGFLQATLNNIACTIKHPKFEEENEYRHFYQPDYSELNLPQHFRNGQFGLTPYVNINFIEKSRLPLKSITIGPCQDFDLESNSVKMLLHNNSYKDVEIIQSEIPLRVS